PPRLCRSPAAPAAETDRSPEPGRRRAGRTSAHPDPTTRPDPRHRGPPHRYPTGPDAPGPGPGSPRGRVADPRPVSDGRAIRGRYPTEAVTARRTRRPSGTPYPGPGGPAWLTRTGPGIDSSTDVTDTDESRHAPAACSRSLVRARDPVVAR